MFQHFLSFYHQNWGTDKLSSYAIIFPWEQFFTGSWVKQSESRVLQKLTFSWAFTPTHVYITKCTSLASSSFRLFSQRPSQTSKVEHILGAALTLLWVVMFGYRRACCKHWHNRSSPICARASSNIGTIYVYTTKCQRENEEFPAIHHPQ